MSAKPPLLHPSGATEHGARGKVLITTSDHHFDFVAKNQDYHHKLRPVPIIIFAVKSKSGVEWALGVVQVGLNPSF